MKRRVWKMVSVVAVASIGLSACSVPAALSVAHHTYGGSPYLQVHFTASLTSSDPALAHTAAALAHLSFDLNEQSRAGTPISQSLNQVNQDLVVWHGTTRVATFLESQSNLYFNVNFTTLAQVPGASSNSSSLAALSLLLGNRWIELPFALIAQYAHSLKGLKLTASNLATGQNQLLNALVSLLARGTTTPTATGFEQAGSMAQLANALVSQFKGVGLPPSSLSKVKGSYALDVTMSGATATAVVVRLVTPTAKHGDAVVKVSATIAHQALAVAVPASPLVITPALLKQFGAGGGSLLGGSLG